MTARGVSVEWGQGVPPGVRAVAAPVVRRWLWLVPTWCHTLNVKWDADDTEGPCATTTESEYRAATLYLNPGLLSEPPERVDALIAHELTHVLLAPLDEAAQSAIETLTDDDTTERAVLKETLRKAVESVTQDLSAALRRRGAA